MDDMDGMRDAEQATSRYLLGETAHLRLSLVFAIVVLVVGVINMVAMLSVMEGGCVVKELAVFAPPPMLIVGMAVSAWVQYHLLGGIRDGLSALESGRISLTDAIYGSVSSYEQSRKWMLVVTFIFILYFAWAFFALLWLIVNGTLFSRGLLISSVNIVLLIAAVGYFYMQVAHQRRWTARMRRLESMEKAVSDELGL